MPGKKDSNRSLGQIDPVRLKAALRAKGLKQYELATHLGVSPVTLNGWIRGRQAPPNGTGAAIENLLGLSPGTLRSSAQFSLPHRSVTVVLSEELCARMDPLLAQWGLSYQTFFEHCMTQYLVQYAAPSAEPHSSPEEA